MTVDLGSAMARKLGVPVEFVPHLASGEIQNSVASDKWDVTFMPVDDERKKFWWRPDPSSRRSRTPMPPACVSAASPIPRRSGLPSAPHRKRRLSPFRGVDAAIAAMKAGEIDCIALSRESALRAHREIPGSRILDGGFLNSSTAVAVPKGRPDALAYVSEFIEEGKGRGSGPKFPGCDEPEKFPGGAGRDETLGVACYVR